MVSSPRPEKVFTNSFFLYNLYYAPMLTRDFSPGSAFLVVSGSGGAFALRFLLTVAEILCLSRQPLNCRLYSRFPKHSPAAKLPFGRYSKQSPTLLYTSPRPKGVSGSSMMMVSLELKIVVICPATPPPSRPFTKL